MHKALHEVWLRIESPGLSGSRLIVQAIQQKLPENTHCVPAMFQALF